MTDQPTTPSPPLTPQAPARSPVLSGDDFAAFNDQLAQITAAGLPLEEGLRLVGQDLRRGPLAAVVRAISADLDRGIPLDQSLAKHGDAFPSTYAWVVQAGMRSGRLPQMLLGLGAHLTLTQKLRAALWRATAYPIAVFAMMLVVLTFIDRAVIPTFREMSSAANSGLGYFWYQRPFSTFDNSPFLPSFTRVVFAAADCVPVFAVALLALVLILVFACRSVRVRQYLADHVALRVPLVGPALRDSKLAVWCDGLRLGAESGLDLPSAVELAASGATPGLLAETRELAESLRLAAPTTLVGRWIPASVRQSIATATTQGNLPAAAGALADFYRRRAIASAEAIPATLTPLLLAFIGICIGLIMFGLLAPMQRILTWLS
jgi:type II secretory pathway component PulF